MAENKQKINLKNVTSKKPLRRLHKNRQKGSPGSRPLTLLELKQLDESTAQALKEMEGEFDDLK
jgi:hypothetical protein